MFSLLTILPSKYLTPEIKFEYQVPKKIDRSEEEKTSINDLDKIYQNNKGLLEKSKTLSKKQHAQTRMYFDGELLKKLYPILALVNRSSITNAYYVEIFPDLHPFIGLDWTYFFPFKNSFNEGKFLWRFLNGNFAADGGASVVPFQYSIFSRAGLLSAFLVSGLVGLLLGGIWGLISKIAAEDYKILFQAIICIFFVYLSIDTLKSSLYAGYGMVVWAVIVFIIIGINFLYSLLTGKLNEANSTKS